MSRGSKPTGNRRLPALRPATPLKPATAPAPRTKDPVDPLEELKTTRAEATTRRAELEALDHRAGALIKSLIESKAYTYADLAAALGVSRQSLQKSASRHSAAES